MSVKRNYDLVVIGSGPGGQKAAIQAAKLGKAVAMVDTNPQVGGVCLHDGTIPSKSFREAIIHLSGYKERFHYGSAYRVKHDVTMDDLTSRCAGIVNDCEQTVRSQLIRNKIDIIEGFGSFYDANTVKVAHGNREMLLATNFVVIATGTSPWHPPKFDFNEDTVLDSDTILHIKRLPASIAVVGGGVIGCEYGSMLAQLGIKVTIIEAREKLLSFVDDELIDTLVYHLRNQKTSIITNDAVVRCTRCPDGRAITYLESGKRIVTDCALVSAGRMGNVKGLNLESIGIEADSRGRIVVNTSFQTNFPNIYAVGDVIGAPALASTSQEQGRRAACHAFGIRDRSLDLPIPYGIYTIPEIAMVGATENELSAKKIPYEVGIGRFSQVERGKIIGDDNGVLKILFNRHTLTVLGVHIIGDSAAELIHVGQTVMGFQGGIDYLAQTVFNYPTLSQSYKVAALDGMNKIVATQGLPDEDPYACLDDLDEILGPNKIL